MDRKRRISILVGSLVVFGGLLIGFSQEALQLHQVQVTKPTSSSAKRAWNKRSNINVPKTPAVSQRTTTTIPYYKRWDHATQTMQLPGTKDPSAPLTSLELLEQVLNNSNNLSSPEDDSCFRANVNATKELADWVVSNNLQLSLPILNVGMPKCGSTTLQHFFKCVGFVASHEENGFQFKKAVDEGKPPISTTRPHHDAILQMDKNYYKCAYPQIQFLDEIHAERPNATFVLNFRPIVDWITSARKWHGMAVRWAHCELPGLICPNGQHTASPYCTDFDLRQWWCGHVKHMREFVNQYPTHKLIELDLYDTITTSKVMAQLFHTNETCWGQSNVNEKLHDTAARSR
jgi:hypothetical protein